MSETLETQTSPTHPKRLVLLDGNSLLYRGFFAMRALTTSAGQPTNAVFSFTMMLLTLLSDWKPDAIFCAWDSPEPTFRHEEYTEYKGTRAETPPDLKPQGPIAREMAEAFRVTGIRRSGFEADDIIGTMARRGKEAGYEVLIVSGDLDALQLVEPGVRVLTTIKGVTDTVIYDEAKVQERYGLEPAQLTDYRALKGDTSDNIPGVPGIGEKTATQLLQQFGTVENLLAHLDEVKQARIRTAIDTHREQMALSKRLATIYREVPLDDVELPAPNAANYTPDYAAVRALFETLEFRTLLRRLPLGELRSKSPEVDGHQFHASVKEPIYQGDGSVPRTPVPGRNPQPTSDLEAEEYDPFAVTEADNTEPVATTDGPVIRDADTPERLETAAQEVRRAYRVGLRLHTDGENILDARLFGVALAVNDTTVFYVPLTDSSETPVNCGANHQPAAHSDGLGGLFDAPSAPTPDVSSSYRTLPALLVTVLEDERIPKVTHDGKSDMAVLSRYGVTLRGIVFDTDLATYLLNAGRRSPYTLETMTEDYVNRKLGALDRKTRKTLDETALLRHDKDVTCRAAAALLAVQKVEEPRLAADKLSPILTDLELPVVPILVEMERNGLLVDVATMNRMSVELQKKIEELEAQIFQLSGTKFSIGSPKQLQEVLFERLQIRATKKTKTGYSTDHETLEELAPDYPIVSLVLEHRALSKLKGTYADAMPALVRPDTGRIHTSLNQTVAATGRLSSSNPNLQNIPIRTAIGREIRRAFIAPPGKVLVSADYSQIELRIFAHVSHDPELRAAFASGEDIHKYTAGKMYAVPVEQVTSDMRRAAKTVNYAVIYGISDFALGRRLGIPMKQAKELKASYFERFPGVRRYLDETIEFARQNGYVQTLFGRRRYMLDIGSRVFQHRQAAERAAANMPIQGSSADIIKRAMIDVYTTLQTRKLQSKMLLQVHDELLFETPKEEVQELAACVQKCMVNAYPLDVALEVEVKTGTTWADVTPVTEEEPILETE